MIVMAATETCWNVDLLYNKSFELFLCILMNQLLDNKVTYSLRYLRIGQKTRNILKWDFENWRLRNKT